MAAPLNVVKVVIGAFVVPWWNRRAFGRALAIPLIMLASFSVTWKFTDGNLPQLSNWLLSALYLALFTLFAVTCHRLVLLDSHSVASSVVPRWSWRETRFALFIVAVGLISLITVSVLVTLLHNMFLRHATPELSSTVVSWIQNASSIPMLYLFTRFSLVFPATAIDQRMTLQSSWALTRNNSWRLFVVVAVLPWIISHAVGLLYRGEASVLEIVLLTCFSFVLMAVEVAALSLSFRELTSMDEPAH